MKKDIFCHDNLRLSVNTWNEFASLISLLFAFSEIGKVRGNLFQINGKKTDPLVLPDASGPPVTLSEKVYVPIKEYPEVKLIFVVTPL